MFKMRILNQCFKKIQVKGLINEYLLSLCNLILSLCQQAFTDHQIKEETLVVIVKL